MTALTRKHSFDGVFDSQRVYRLLLTAMSNPTRVVNIKEYADRLFGECPEILALAFTLLDNEVRFAVCGSATLSKDIAFLTLSKETGPENADYIFVYEPLLLEAAIAPAKCGTLRDPHKSATVIVRNAGAADCTLKLRGPGIKETADFSATETVRAALELRDAQHYEYPQGVDFIFAADNGDVFALPRLVGKEAL